MNAVIVWILALMTWVAPPERIAAQPQFRGYEETAEQRTARYESIAEDLFAVAYDPDERPLFGGPIGRARTAVTLLGVAWHESGFARDVDIGPCVKGRCDGGASFCMLQIRLGAGSTVEGWTGADLFADRRKCFRAGLRRLRASFRACAKLPPEHLFDAYAGGRCGDGPQHRAGIELVGSARRLEAHGGLPGPDALFLPSGGVSSAAPAPAATAP